MRALAAFYVRLTFRSLEVYEILEPLMKDYRKLRVVHAGKCTPCNFGRQKPTVITGGYSLTHFDEFIDELLTQERVCDIILPRLTQRSVLEETEGLPPRKSLLVRISFLPVSAKLNLTHLTRRIKSLNEKAPGLRPLLDTLPAHPHVHPHHHPVLVDGLVPGLQPRQVTAMFRVRLH